MKKETELKKNPVVTTTEAVAARIAAQGWIGLAVWMSFGLLFEGLIGFRSPAYLQDPLRRELFRLAHAHGAVLSMLLLIAAIYLDKNLIAPPVAAISSLRIGVVLMPVGFLLGGIWHYESDPNALISAAPIGGLLIIFAVISIALSLWKK